MKLIENIQIKNFGPLKSANITLGDLTFLVGPQASGKSLFLELLKLIIDRQQILYTLDSYNYILKENPDTLFNVYFGEGMAGVWNKNTSIIKDGETIQKKYFLKETGSKWKEQMFYIPAQRILSIVDGRPKGFGEFDFTTPYVLRYFSETLRRFMQGGLGESKVIFPIKTRLKGAMEQQFDKTVFHGGKIVMDEYLGQKKMKMQIDGMEIPFMTWSAGQKEFMPLLLGIYCLSGPPTSIVKKENYQYIVIEEPEMGLHPQAIKSVLLQIIELIHSGYRVIISTHSSLPIEFTWAFNSLKESVGEGREDALCSLFDVDNNSSIRNIFKQIFSKSIHTYYFNSTNHEVTDITSLDVFSENDIISEWGGLSEFAGRVSDVVSRFSYE